MRNLVRNFLTLWLLRESKTGLANDGQIVRENNLEGAAADMEDLSVSQRFSVISILVSLPNKSIKDRSETS